MINFVFILFISCSVLGHQIRYHEKDLPGIVLIPGDGGNKLETKLEHKKTFIEGCHTDVDWHLSWVNITELAFAECWAEDMKLHYNFTSHTSHNTPGVSVRAPSFGKVDSMLVLDNFAFVGYFSSIVYMLEYMGYSRNVNIMGAGFDFRYAPNELTDYFQSLKKLIEDTADETDGPVVLIAHSMGAPLTNYFLNLQTQHWKDTYIRNLISLAGAWGGSTKTIKVFAAGDDMDSPFDQYKVRSQQRSDPSLAFLLPDPDLWGDEVMATILGTNYTMNDMEAFLGTLNLVEAIEIYHDIKPMLYKTKLTPGVTVHCLYGNNVTTGQRIEYVSPRYFPDTPIIHSGPGDGTVNHRSLDLCRQYRDLQDDPIYIQSYDNIDHMGILHDSGVMKYISDVVTEEALLRRAKKEPKSEQLFITSTLGIQGTGLSNQGTGLGNQGTGSDNQGTGLEVQGTGSDNQGTGSDNQGTGLDNQGTGLDNQGTGLDNHGPGFREAGNLDFEAILKEAQNKMKEYATVDDVRQARIYQRMKQKQTLKRHMQSNLLQMHLNELHLREIYRKNDLPYHENNI